jgi:glycosyltransferase involved in cell wall biosynthesis
MRNKFIVLVTVHNAVEWIDKCILSVRKQDYDNYRLLLIDDHSTDGTWDIVSKYNACIIRNDKNMVHSLINMVTGLKAFFFDPEDIIVCLDGDDWFENDHVLSYLNEVYQEDVWLTYGQFVPLSGGYKDYCKPLSAIGVNSRNYRKKGIWVTSHLKTFKKKCWDLIDKEDFKRDGEWIITCGDCAMMYPIIEMAGDKRIRFIDKVLYVYNDLNPMNHKDTYTKESLETARYLQNKSSYDLID